MKPVKSFKTATTELYFFPDRIQITSEFDLVNPGSSLLSVIFNGLYLYLFIVFFVTVNYGIYMAYDWGEDILIGPLAILSLGFFYQILWRWGYFPAQNMNLSQIIDFRFFKSIPFFRRALMVIHYKSIGNRTRKTRIYMLTRRQDSDTPLKEIQLFIESNYPQKCNRTHAS